LYVFRRENAKNSSASRRREKNGLKRAVSCNRRRNERTHAQRPTESVSIWEARRAYERYDYVTCILDITVRLLCVPIVVRIFFIYLFFFYRRRHNVSTTFTTRYDISLLMSIAVAGGRNIIASRHFVVTAADNRSAAARVGTYTEYTCSLYPNVVFGGTLRRHCTPRGPPWFSRQQPSPKIRLFVSIHQHGDVHGTVRFSNRNHDCTCSPIEPFFFFQPRIGEELICGYFYSPTSIVYFKRKITCIT